MPEWPEPTLRPVNYVFDESGTLDPDSYPKITGRKKDLIITSTGKNVTPAKYRVGAARVALDLGGGRLWLRRITELRCVPQPWRGPAGRLTLADMRAGAGTSHATLDVTQDHKKRKNRRNKRRAQCLD